jgi:hypothetical protein
MTMTMTMTGDGLAPMSENEPVERTSVARLTPDEVVTLMNAAIATTRAEGIAIPPDLVRKTFAATRTLAALARRNNGDRSWPLLHN